ncbi:MAG: hypothetical protein SGI87_10675 [Flavobacteriales bacterium]|nr:hypothetical protein [Flavobacteriales bacterium]
MVNAVKVAVIGQWSETELVCYRYLNGIALQAYKILQGITQNSLPMRKAGCTIY